MPQDDIERIIRDYLDGKDTPEGKAYFEQWASRMYHNEAFVSSLSEKQLQLLEQKLFAGIHARISRAEKQPAKNTGRPVVKRWMFPATGYRVAASILLLISLGLILYQYGNHLPDALFPVRYVKQTAPHGKNVTFRLADGTRIDLRSGGTIQYRQNLHRRSRREVILTGEAYFQVTKNPQKPFLVTTRQAQVEVLGTRFNVKEIHRDSSVVVAVTEGKVTFQAAHQPAGTGVLLTANTVGVLEKGLQPGKLSGEVANYLSWRSGRISFRNTPLPAVARQLEHLYGVRVELEIPTPEQLSLTMTMRHTELADVAGLIAASLGLEYEYQNDTVIFHQPERKTGL